MQLSRFSVLMCLLIVRPSIADEGDLKPTAMPEVIPAAVVTPAQPERLPSLASRPTPANPSTYETTILGPDEIIEGDVVVTEPEITSPAPPVVNPPAIRPSVVHPPSTTYRPVPAVPHVQITPSRVIVERIVHRPHFPLLQPQPHVTVSRTYKVHPWARETTVVTRKAVKTYVPAELSTVEVEVDPGFVPGQPIRNLIRAHRAKAWLR